MLSVSQIFEVKQTVFAIMIKFSSWVDRDLYCKHFYHLPRLIYSLVFHLRISVTWAPVCRWSKLVNVYLRKRKTFIHHIPFCALCFAWYYSSWKRIPHSPLCVCENGIFCSPFILFHSQLSWKRKCPGLMFEEPEKNRFVFIKNELYYVMCIFSVRAWMDQVHYTTASF